MSVDAQDAADLWFRRRGLPMVVDRSRRGRKLLERSTAVQLFLVIVSLLAYLLQSLPSGDHPESADASGPPPVDDSPFTDLTLQMIVAVVVLISLLGPALLAWLGARVVRRRSARLQLIVAIVLTVLTAVVLPLSFAANGKVVPYVFVTAPDDAPSWYVLADVSQSIAAILVVLGLIWVGVGAILLWGVRRALSQIGRIGAMASRVLPLLLLVVMFIFFTGELWQVANRMTRAQMWAVVGFLALVAVGFIVATFSDELPALRARSRTSAELQAKVEDTPLAGTTVVDAPRLSWPERINIVLVLFVAQAMQIVVFATLVFVFFLIFGSLVLSPEAEADLLGAQSPAPGTFYGLPIGVSNAKLQVALFLAAFAGLSFTASTTAEEPIRRSFFDPLLEDVAFSLATRDAYRATWPHHPAPVS